MQQIRLTNSRAVSEAQRPNISVTRRAEGWESAIRLPWIAAALFFSTPGEAADYYVATNGDDESAGTLDEPWKTVNQSVAKLQPGDVLHLRGGVYFETVMIGVKGTEPNRITIRVYKDEEVVIDGGLRDFRRVPNDDWVVHDAARGLYRSRKAYPIETAGLRPQSGDTAVHAYLPPEYDYRHLVPYERYENLATNNQDNLAGRPTYVGPGIFFNNRDKHLYVRLEPSKYASLFEPFHFPQSADPRQNPIAVAPLGAVVLFTPGAAYIDLENLKIRHRNKAIDLGGRVHDIRIKNCELLGGRFHVDLPRNTRNILIDRATIPDGFPPWVAYGDIKHGSKPAYQLQQVGFRADGDNIEIRNSYIQDVFVVINVNGDNVRFNHNDIFRVSDAVLLFAPSDNVEVGYNRILKSAKAISWVGTPSATSTSPDLPGTKYIHHNVIDVARPTLQVRLDPGLERYTSRFYGPERDGLTWNRPFAGHGKSEADPWKFYNNTVIMGADFRSVGMQINLRMDGAPGIPHEVYNNIFIQTMDHFMITGMEISEGKQIFDGNLYHRVPSNASEPLLRNWDGADFETLAEFKKSRAFTASRTHYKPGFENSGIEANPQLSAEYVPSPKSAAASGAIDLSDRGWPGADGDTHRGALAPGAARR